MSVKRGDLFVFPFRGKNRSWEVKLKIEKRWRAEIIKGSYAGCSADFDEFHLARMISLQKILRNLPVGQVEKGAKGHVHR